MTLSKTKRQSERVHKAAWEAAWAGPRRRSGGGGLVVVLGVIIGGVAGALITDPVMWRDIRAAVGAPAPVYPQFKGRPSHITDGDTFRMGKASVRLLGIDAPEMSSKDGPRAKVQLTELVSRTPGPLVCQDTGERTYERVVARCFTADGQDLSAAMVENGWATVMVNFSGGPYLPALFRAMWNRRGMWTHFGQA